MKPRTLWTSLAMLIVIMSAACGNNSAIVAETPTSSPAASATPAPTDTAAATATAAPTDTPPPVATPTPSGPFPTGRYKPESVSRMTDMEFREDGSYWFRLKDGTTTEGTYSVSGDLITIHNTAAECVEFPGILRWTFDGQSLSFVQLEDKCEPLMLRNRKADYQRAWIRQP